MLLSTTKGTPQITTIPVYPCVMNVRMDRQKDRQTSCTNVYVGLAQARPNYTSKNQLVPLESKHHDAFLA